MAQYKNVDIIPDDSISRVHLSQNDVGRTLIFYLFENGLSWSVPASSTIKIQGTKPSGFGFSVSCTYSGNAVTCVTTDEMTDEYGQIEAELVITSSDESQVFGTSNFILDIEKNPHPSSTEDGSTETAIALTARVEALESAVSELEASEGLTDAIKLALLQIAQKVAYIDDDGQDYYDDLYDALYPPAPPATLTSISCVYTQSGTVYDTDTLDSLKSDLVVTAHYDDSSTQTVSAYTLSGTLSVGTSTITVAYGGKTTTFTVTVSHQTQTVKTYFSDTAYTSNYLKKTNGTDQSIGGAGYTELDYVDGMYIHARMNSSWSAYLYYVLFDGTNYSSVAMTKTGSEVYPTYEDTLSGYTATKVYVNFKLTEIDDCYYEVEV